ncbi:hypothetical protein JHK87_039345 [Glycine soja]|nr:hypothetical protein JHK87_039345 [Glycine soja]
MVALSMGKVGNRLGKRGKHGHLAKCRNCLERARYDSSIHAYLPHDRLWIKQRTFQHLKKLAH